MPLTDPNFMTIIDDTALGSNLATSQRGNCESFAHREGVGRPRLDVVGGDQKLARKWPKMTILCCIKLLAGQTCSNQSDRCRSIPADLGWFWPKILRYLVQFALEGPNYKENLSLIKEMSQIGKKQPKSNQFNSSELIINISIELICSNYIMGNVNFVPIDLPCTNWRFLIN